MKIAFVANSRFPSERAQSDQVMAMCSAFAELGHEVKLFVPDRRPVLAEDPFVYYKKQKTFSFERVPCLDTLRFPWLGPIGLWTQTFTFVRRLQSRLTEYRPDVVYSREPYVFGFRIAHTLRVWESHTFHASRWARRVLRNLDAVVTLTSASRDRFIETGIRSERILVEPDAVDPTLFADMPERNAARTALGIPSEVFLCLYVGKFTTMGMGKGLDHAIQGVERLRHEGRNIRVLAIGGTAEELQSYARFASSDIDLRGHVPQSELKRYYAAADALLMTFPYTTHFAYYMSPLKLFEYLMSGVPMLVTNLPSVREIVDERSAFFATPGDVASISEALARMMDDPAEAHRRVEAASALSLRYTWLARARRIAEWLPTISRL